MLNQSYPQRSSRAALSVTLLPGQNLQSKIFDAGHSICNLHIQAITETDFYKYLGIPQGTHARVSELKDALLSEFLRRGKLVLKSNISGKSKINALNIFAIISLAYAFRIFPWTKAGLENVHRRLWAVMSKFRMHHLKRMNLAHDIGGRGVVDVVTQHHRQVDSLGANSYSKVGNIG